MNTDLLRRILDKARDDETNPAAAMAISDLMRDVQDLEDVKDDADFDSLNMVPVQLSDFRELRQLVKTQPFEHTPCDETDDQLLHLEELTPGAFSEWLAELERLAQ